MDFIWALLYLIILFLFKTFNDNGRNRSDLSLFTVPNLKLSKVFNDAASQPCGQTLFENRKGCSTSSGQGRFRDKSALKKAWCAWQDSNLRPTD